MKFKTKDVETRFTDMADLAQRIAKEMDLYSQEKYGIQLTLTTTVSTKAEDTELSRTSDTHRTRRAFDIRTGDLPDELVAELCSVFRKKYGRFGAVTSALPSLIVYRPHGTGPHLHVQLSRKYALTEINYDK
tara:strand:+ start:963 stop:1358 length:396 start_codon:yes stop_codon:yes gene_type:complete